MNWNAREATPRARAEVSPRSGVRRNARPRATRTRSGPFTKSRGRSLPSRVALHRRRTGSRPVSIPS